MKNYNEMCTLLDEDIKGGDSKRSQTKDWQRYFAYEKQGHKYIIKAIYEEPLPKIDNTLYIRLIESLLAYELSTKPDYTNHYTKTNLFYILGMVNNYYLQNNRYQVENEITAIPKWQKNKFFERSNNKLSDILFSALDSMEKRCLLNYSRIYIVVEKKRIDGKIENTYRTANEFEHNEIMRAERNVLKEMGLKFKPFLRMDEFYGNVNEKLHELFGWDFIYSEIKLNYNKDQMQDALSEIKGDFEQELKKNKSDLNSNIIEALNKQAEKQLLKNKDDHKALFMKQIDENDEWMASNLYDPDIRLDNFFKFPVDYVENQKTLAELFLKISGA